MSEDATKQIQETSETESGENAPDKHSPESSLNLDELRELADLVSEHGFTDFEFENENIRVRLSKNLAPQIIQTTQAAPTQAAAPTSVSTAGSAAQTESDGEGAATDEDLQTITSPIVGTLYRAPSPDKDPYVKEGDNIAVGAVVCIVEAMKLMNEIESEFAGEIVKVYVENGQPVEFGQPLFGVRK